MSISTIFFGFLQQLAAERESQKEIVEQFAAEQVRIKMVRCFSPSRYHSMSISTIFFFPLALRDLNALTFTTPILYACLFLFLCDFRVAVLQARNAQARNNAIGGWLQMGRRESPINVAPFHALVSRKSKKAALINRSGIQAAENSNQAR